MYVHVRNSHNYCKTLKLLICFLLYIHVYTLHLVGIHVQLVWPDCEALLPRVLVTQYPHPNGNVTHILDRDRLRDGATKVT